MLGRRYFRIKVLQALYSWFLGAENRQEVAEKNLLTNIDKFFELYYLQFSFFTEIVDFYRRRSEDARHKFLPTAEELNPNLKFLENQVVLAIMNNMDLQKKVISYKFSWVDEQEMIRKVYKKLSTGKDLREYLGSETSSFEADREIVYKVFRKHISRSTGWQSYCEDRSIYWNDDFQLATIFAQKTIQMITEQYSEELDFTTLFGKDEEDDAAADREFILELFRKTITHSRVFEVMIDNKTRNWELERIALTDIILLKMALSELLYFSTIPVKVTMNEYIEISKNYSTPKSKLFINGVLDKLVEDLQSEKKIKKRGRGLIT